MKNSIKALAMATIAAATILPIQANAQVAGIATADTSVAIAKTKALGTGFTQVNTQYASYVEQIKTKRNEMNNLNAQLDTNGDKVLDQAEFDAAVKAKNPALMQIQQKEKEIQNLQTPIIKAEMFVVSEIAKKYNAAQESVVKSKKINMLLTPESFIWAPKNIDVTDAITAELDRLAPTVAIAPPANWNPDRNVAAVYKQIQQLLGLAARARASQTAAAAPAAAPAAQPSGR